MVTNIMYTQALLKSKLALADAVSRLLLLERDGCSPSWEKVTCEALLIKSAEHIISLSDYTSKESIKIYYDLINIAGVNDLSDVFIDPYAQIQGVQLTNPDPTGVFDNFYNKNQTDEKLLEIKQTMPDIWAETVVFTYDGSTRIFPLDFTPKGNIWAEINGGEFRPFIDYKFKDNQIIITDNYILQEGIDYRIQITYDKQ